MNLLYKTKLLQFHDNLITKLKKRYEYNEFVSDEQIQKDKQLSKDMSNNIKIRIGRIIAPSSVVIKHYCLIDILNNSPDNYDKIYKLINQLSPISPNGRLWLEGYSYWIECKDVLELYSNVFNNNHRYIVSIPINLFILEVDTCFQKTSYVDNNISYPVMLSSLNKIPLQNHLQDYKMSIPNINIYPIRKMGDTYEIRKTLLGFNTRVSGINYKVKIEKANNKIIYNLSFSKVKEYIRFNNQERKYVSNWEEIKDTFLRLDRLFSALKLLIRS